MPSSLTPSDTATAPDSWNDSALEDAFVFDYTATNSYSGPESITEGILTPTFQQGEVWQIKATLTLSSEPSDNIIVFGLRDEDDNYWITRSTIPQYGGNMAQFNAVVTYAAASDSGAAGSPSPDIHIEIVGSDSGNYWVEVECVRLRSELDTSINSYPGTSTESID